MSAEGHPAAAPAIDMQARSPLDESGASAPAVQPEIQAECPKSIAGGASLQPFEQIEQARRHAALAQDAAAIASGFSQALALRLQATHATLRCLNTCNASLLTQCQEQAAFASGLGTFAKDLCHQVPAAGRAFEELLNMESRLNSLSLAMDILEESTTSLEQAALTE